MPGPGLIAGYLGTLFGQLPGPVVEELAEGLEETYRRQCVPVIGSIRTAEPGNGMVTA